jgi:eukaryotic-like serine/threonine-protein kinase
MNRELFVEVEEAYNEVAGLPPEARTKLLYTVYRERPDVRQEVETLLKYKDAAQQICQSTVVMTVAELFAEGETELFGKIIGDRYRIRESLGSGGMAEVYLADHIALETPFALKRPKSELRLDPEFRRSFLEEARRAVMLKHENVARVHDVIEVGDDMFVVMEYIEGETLERRIQNLGRPFTIDEFLPIAIQCASALVAAHEKRIVHLDVKPANIMLTPAGQVKVCDFGVARRLSSEKLDGTTMVSDSRWVLAGTPAYMAPEVILSSSFDERADLFSLGTVFYEMLSGHNPFHAETTIATTAKVVSHDPPAISETHPDFDPRLERIVRRMMAKEPDERYASAVELVEDLTALRRARSRFQDISRTVREALTESKWMKVAAAVVLLSLIGAPVAWTYRDRLQQSLGIAPIAVQKNLVALRFRAIGTGSDIQAYADGLAETLNSKLTQLTQGSEWRVAPTRLVQEQGVKTPEAARKELGANLVLDGSLEFAGNTVRINLNLIDTATNKARAQTVDGEVSDPLGAQDRVVSRLVDMLGLELKAGKDRTKSPYEDQPEAMRYYNLGRGYLLNYQQPENIESAIDVFQSAIAAYPQFALAYAGLGEAYWYKFRTQFDKGQLDSSRSACERSLTYDSQLPEAHICLGNFYNSKGQHNLALEQFQQARSGPDFDVLTGLAEAYEGLRSYDLAEKHLRQAVDRNKFNWIAYGRLGSFYLRRSRCSEAEDLWTQALRRSPENPRAMFSLGAIYLTCGKPEDAVKVLERSITLRETLAAYSNLGMAYLRMGQIEKALSKFQHAVEMGQDYRAIGNLARAYYFSPGRKAEAIDAYNRAIRLGSKQLEINPRNADAHALLALYHSMLLQKEPALHHLEAALDWDPDYWHYLEYAAIIHNQFKDRDKTFEYLEKALARGFSTLEMRSEMEFSNLYPLPKFQALLQTYQNRQ